MKNIIPSNFWHDMTDKLRKIIPGKLQEIIPVQLQNLIPDKYRKWIPLALVLILVVILACCIPSCSSGETAEPVLYIVDADNLNVRKNHSEDSKVLGALPVDLEIEILEQTTIDDTTWGRIDSMTLPDGTKIKGGWVNLHYVRLPGDPDADPTEPTNDIETSTQPLTPTIIGDMGTVITGKLNIRSGAGSGNEAIGSYLKGDRIEILETKTVDDTVWGRTSKGWVGMGYVKMDGTAPSTSEGSSASNITTDGAYQILGYGVVDLGTLNVRSGPGTEHDKIHTVSEGTRYAFYQISGDWVRIEDGWVSTDYFYIEGTTADDAATVTIKVDDLNIRTGPSTSFRSVGTYMQGETVEVLAQADNWGYTGKGWISMTHVEPAIPSYATGTGTITSGLNIRKEPNADAELVDTYKEGDRVTITEVKDGWGKTDKGWINLKYVKYD